MFRVRIPIFPKKKLRLIFWFNNYFFFFCFAKIFGFSLILFKLIIDFFQFINENFKEENEHNLFFLSKVINVFLTLYFKLTFKLLRPLLRGLNYNY